MPRITVNRREFLGISLAGALTWFWKPQEARALGGKLPEFGVAAPDFNLPGTIGGTTTPNLSLDSWRGKWLVLYFYPRDFTSGCTIEAHGFPRCIGRLQRPQL